MTAARPDPCTVEGARPRGAHVHQLDFDHAGATLTACIDTLIIAGWTGRDRAAVEQHIAELEAHDLVERYLGRPGVLPVGTAMYCGTLAVIGAIGGGERFEIELDDPRLKRTLRHSYVARCLDMAD